MARHVLFAWVLALVSASGLLGCRQHVDAAQPAAPSGYPVASEGMLAAQDASEEAAPAPPPAPAPEAPVTEAPATEAPAKQAPAAGQPGETTAEGGDRDGGEGFPLAKAGTTVSAKNPRLIYTATLTLAVWQTREAMAAIEDLSRAQGGYLVRQTDSSITVRVPAGGFQSALDAIGGVGDELHRDVNVRDVTDELTDLEVRLRNSEEVRRKLEQLLDRAANVEHALAVERELERVTRTIEQIKGRLKLLGELLSFSTITVNFQARRTDQVSTETRLPFEWLGQLGLPTLLSF